MKNTQLYVDLWRLYLREIESSLKTTSQNCQLRLKKEQFESVGNRKLYGFRLELEKGTLKNNISGSEVARDLYRRLLADQRICSLLSEKIVVLKLDKYFNLHIIYN